MTQIKQEAQGQSSEQFKNAGLFPDQLNVLSESADKPFSPVEPGILAMRNNTSERDQKNFITKALILNSASGDALDGKKQLISLVRPREFILNQDVANSRRAISIISPQKSLGLPSKYDLHMKKLETPVRLSQTLKK